MYKLKLLFLMGFFVSNVYSQTLLQEGSLVVDSQEFELALEHVVPEQAQDMMRSKESNIRGFLLDYYTYKLMARDAREKGLLDNPGVAIRADYLLNRLLTEALINDYVESQPLPDLEMLAKEKYDSDKAKYLLPEQVRAEHILIAVGPERTEAEALLRAEEVYKKLKATPKEFSNYAQQYSDDPSVAENNGDLGYFPRGAMVKPFEDAAFELKKGKISEPVLTNFGYHIIRVTDKRKEKQQPFKEVKAALVEEARKLFQDQKRDELVAKYRDSPETIINDKGIAEFVEKILNSK